jgi:hypothetical protein
MGTLRRAFRGHPQTENPLREMVYGGSDRAARSDGGHPGSTHAGPWAWLAQGRQEGRHAGSPAWVDVLEGIAPSMPLLFLRAIGLAALRNRSRETATLQKTARPEPPSGGHCSVNAALIPPRNRPRRSSEPVARDRDPPENRQRPGQRLEGIAPSMPLLFLRAIGLAALRNSVVAALPPGTAHGREGPRPSTAALPGTARGRAPTDVGPAATLLWATPHWVEKR